MQWASFRFGGISHVAYYYVYLFEIKKDTLFHNRAHSKWKRGHAIPKPKQWMAVNKNHLTIQVEVSAETEEAGPQQGSIMNYSTRTGSRDVLGHEWTLGRGPGDPRGAWGPRVTPLLAEKNRTVNSMGHQQVAWECEPNFLSRHRVLVKFYLCLPTEEQQFY